MDRETIIKYEAYNILKIALRSEDDYEGTNAIIKRLNILINTLQLEEHIERGEDDDGDNTSDDEEEESRSLNNVEYVVKVYDDEVIVVAE